VKKKNVSFKRLKSIYARYFPYFKNKYVITIIIFFGWMLFFDDNDIITRIKLQRQLARLKTEKEFYKEEIKKIEETNRQLFSSDETLEKFAREQYLMKRDNEEIFLIVEKKE
jgi:cell division protein FtsB